MSIRVVKKDLMPSGNSPAAVIGIAESHFIALSHEALNVIRTETEVTMPHRVDELLHLEASFQVTLGPVKFDVTIGQKVHFPCVSSIFTLTTNDGVSFVVNCTQVKQGLVELGQAGQVIGADVHVMELEIHGGLSFIQMMGRYRDRNPTVRGIECGGMHAAQHFRNCINIRR